MKRQLKTPPIHRVPTEILLTIFKECLPDVRYRKPSLDDAPLLLTHVCSTWRMLVVQTSHMWTSLCVDILERRPTPLSIVELWVDRIGALPFDFAFRLDQWPPVPLQLVRQAILILNLLANKMSLWRDIQLVLPGSYKLLRSIPIDTAGDHLSSLTIDLQDWKEEEMDALNRIFKSARSLRKLTWSNRASWSSWDRSFDDFLCKMDISWGSLTHMVFDAWICLGDLLYVLNQCTNLVECDLRHFGGGFVTPSDCSNSKVPRLLLPKLRTLSIYQLYLNTGLGSLLDSVQCPNLRSFTAICGFTDNVPWPQHQLLSFLEQSACSLNYLSFDYTGISEAELIECLSFTSHLTQLRISDGRGKIVASEKLLLALTHNQDRLPLCPNLETLYLELLISAPQGMLADMVDSRNAAQRGRSVKPIRRLGFTGSHSPTRKQDIQRLKNLVKKNGLAFCVL